MDCIKLIVFIIIPQIKNRLKSAFKYYFFSSHLQSSPHLHPQVQHPCLLQIIDIPATTSSDGQIISQTLEEIIPRFCKRKTSPITMIAIPKNILL